MTTWREIASGRPRTEWVAIAEDAVTRGLLAPPSVAAALLDIWPDRENVRPLQERPIDAWLGLHAALHGAYAVDGRLAEHLRPRAPLTLYRAARPGAEHGLSWSPFRETAEDFRRRFGPAAVVWAAEVPPARMLCAYAGGGSRIPWEIVADVRGIGAVRATRETNTLEDYQRFMTAASGATRHDTPRHAVRADIHRISSDRRPSKRATCG